MKEKVNLMKLLLNNVKCVSMWNIECNFTNMLKQVFGVLLYEEGIFGRGGGSLHADTCFR